MYTFQLLDAFVTDIFLHALDRPPPPDTALHTCNAYPFLFLFLNQSMMMMMQLSRAGFCVKVWQGSAWESADQNTLLEASTKTCCFTLFSTTNPIVNLQALHFWSSCVYLSSYCW